MSPRKSSEPMKQSKLSFSSKRTASATTSVKSAKSAVRKQPSRAASSPILDGEPIDISDDEPVTPKLKKRRLAAPKRVQDDAEVAATVAETKETLDVADKRWRKLFGQSREKMGSIDPVHAKGQTMVNHILRVFDLSYEYGPCVGVSRLERWERAEALGLNPPPEVKQILLTKEGSTDEQYTHSVFYGEV